MVTKLSRRAGLLSNHQKTPLLSGVAWFFYFKFRLRFHHATALQLKEANDCNNAAHVVHVYQFYFVRAYLVKTGKCGYNCQV
jgi:hypothetical protein